MTDTTELLDDSSPQPSCQRCGELVLPRDRFCEACGTDLRMMAHWTAEAALDEEYFRAFGSAGASLPAERPLPLVVPLPDTATIGRAHRDGTNSPTIDLSGFDPGVSHAHAELRVLDEGVEVVDVGSANGTRVHSAPGLLTQRQPVMLRDGDRLHVGLWTRITLRREFVRDR